MTGSSLPLVVEAAVASIRMCCCRPCRVWLQLPGLFCSGCSAACLASTAVPPCSCLCICAATWRCSVCLQLRKSSAVAALQCSLARRTLEFRLRLPHVTCCCSLLCLLAVGGTFLQWRLCSALLPWHPLQFPLGDASAHVLPHGSVVSASS
jgi:hypothetical protein